MATWERVYHRLHAGQEQLWIIQGHPAAVRPRYHGATDFRVCSVGKPTPPLPVGELERVADGLR